MEKAIKLIIICFGLAVISFFPVVTPAESQNASLPFTLDEIQDICQSRNSTEVPSLNCEYINRCLNYGSSISKCYTDSKVAPPVIQDENDELYEEDENETLYENETDIDDGICLLSTFCDPDVCCLSTNANYALVTFFHGL
jgi:hypothetical protein